MKQLEEKHLAQYQLIASRRASMDALMWQVPVLSLTAQAFLFSIALGADSGELSRSIAAILAFLASMASIQLMSKHRYFEVRDSIWLEEFEKWYGLSVVHSKPNDSEGGFIQRHIVRASSFKVWVATLAIFGLAALVVLFVPASYFS